MGHRLLRAAARYVRHGHLVGTRPPAGISARPHRHQAALHRARGRGSGFGSELKVLFGHPRVTRRLDLTGLGDFPLLYADSRTLVLPEISLGHYLEWRNGATKVTPYWNLAFAPDPSIKEEDARAELDVLLRESVREQLVSDVPLGVWSSGGIDSSTLLHYAAELGARPIKTFSMVFESKSCDESPYFREIARMSMALSTTKFELHRDSEIVSAIEDHSLFR